MQLLVLLLLLLQSLVVALGVLCLEPVVRDRCHMSGEAARL